MATPFADTPKWFDTNYYLDQKVAQMQLADPKGNWDRAAVIKDFEAAGFDNPYDHYKLYGDIEGLSANPLFNNAEYLAAKAALMGSTWTVEMVAKDIQNAGLTLMEHYIKFGGKYENLSPSSEFNQDKYFDAKLDMMQTAEPDKGWTLEKVKADFAAAGLSALEHYLLYGEVEGLDKYDYSVNGDPIPHPGNTKIVLTTGADVATKDATVAELKTTDRDDTISGVVSTLASTGTFNAGDVIDGGAGVDTLKLDMKTSFTYKSGSVKNVEHIVLDNATGKSFDAKGVEKALTYTVDGGDKGTTIIKNVDSTETGYMLKQATGKFDVQINDSALTGKTDTVSLWLQGVGTGAADGDRVELDVRGTSTTGEVEGLNLIANGKDNFVKLTEDHKTVSVFGAGNIDVKVAAGLTSFDATTASGKVAADFTNALTTLKTINGGTADDTFTVGALANTAVVDGGQGSDTLDFGKLASGAAIKSTITDVETFKVTTESGSGFSGSLTFDLSKVEGLETFKITGDAVAASGDFVLSKATAYDSLNLQIDSKLTSVKSFDYDGNGVLNVSMNGDANGTNTALTKLVAKNITDLTINNAAENGILTVTQVEAANATSLTIDTGDQGGVTVAGAAVNKLGKVETITFEGDGSGSFTFSSASASSSLTSVDAQNLDNKLTLNLTNATTEAGVEVTLGKGGTVSLMGTAQADTIRLGAGDDAKITLVAGSAANVDHIIGFNDSGVDSFVLGSGGTITGTAIVSGSAATPAADVVKDKIYSISDKIASLVDVADNGGVEKAIADALGVVKTGADIAAGESAFALLSSNEGVGIYKITFAATSSGSDVSASDFTVQLMGIADGADMSDFSASSFVAAV